MGKTPGPRLGRCGNGEEGEKHTTDHHVLNGQDLGFTASPKVAGRFQARKAKVKLTRVKEPSLPGHGRR